MCEIEFNPRVSRQTTHTYPLGVPTGSVPAYNPGLYTASIRHTTHAYKPRLQARKSSQGNDAADKTQTAIRAQTKSGGGEV